MGLITGTSQAHEHSLAPPGPGTCQARLASLTTPGQINLDLLQNTYVVPWLRRNTRSHHSTTVDTACSVVCVHLHPVAAVHRPHPAAHPVFPRRYYGTHMVR